MSVSKKPKTIEEEVIKHVISFMEYRDEEIEHLKEQLKNHGLRKCLVCDEYRISARMLSCDYCGVSLDKCDSCDEGDDGLRHIKIGRGSWIVLCDKCEPKKCTTCTNFTRGTDLCCDCVYIGKEYF